MTMPDVDTPLAEEEALETEVEETEDLETPEEETEEPEAEAEETEEPEEEPEDTSAAEELEKLRKENEELKANKPEPKKQVPPQAKASEYFLNQFVPQAKKVFAEAYEAGDAEKQFQVMQETADNLVGAVLRDQVAPAYQSLFETNVQLKNELDLTNLRYNEDGTLNSGISKLLPQVRKKLDSMDINARAKEGIVSEIFDQILGSTSRSGALPKVKKRPLDTNKLKDVAAGGGKTSKSKSRLELNSEQASELDEINREQDKPMTKEQYLSKVKARQQRMKQMGKTVIPNTLRGGI